jgi:hypothetical protein
MSVKKQLTRVAKRACRVVFVVILKTTIVRRLEMFGKLGEAGVHEPSVVVIPHPDRLPV